MFYVYLLKSKKDNKYYTGFAHDLRARLHQHNTGKTFSTKSRGPFEVIFYEAYLNKYDALRREKYLKSSKGKLTLKTMLKEYFSQSSR